MKITKDQAEIMLKKMPEMAEKIYEDYPEIKPSKVVDSWDKLKEIEGFYVNALSDIKQEPKLINHVQHKNVFKTQKQAESALAYAQLTQLMADCGDCDVDWTRYYDKYCIVGYSSKVMSDNYAMTLCFLAFNTENIRDEFMLKHEALIKTFYQL